jgi:hypothetical protein
LKSTILVRLGHGLLAGGLVLTSASALLLFAPAPVEALPATVDSSELGAEADGSSATTIAWADTHTDTTVADYSNFQNLSVTVGQTEGLVNQGIKVSWKGAKPTSAGEFSTNYLSFMQCWGDASGPTPEQCQWGTPNATISNLMGTGAAGRSLTEGEDPLLVDPNTGQYPAALKLKPPRTNPNLRAFAYPFTAVNGDSSFDVAKFFNSSTGNEVDAARTGSNGTGAIVFETQTSLEAPDLGCGAITSSGNPRSCWLVIVPRGEYNLDGQLAATASPSARVLGSPLSPSAWQNRIEVRLAFRPVSTSCPIGNAERRVVGAETIADAVTSWQPALCATGPTYGFSQIGDGEGRRQIVSGVDGGSKLAFVTNPLDAATAGDAKIAYAPVAATGIVVAFNIEYALDSDAANFADNGTLVSSLTLNARLLAKLLTQSYRSDIPDGGAADGLGGNPKSLVKDPEFLALNPTFADFASDAQPDGLIVALGSSDANALVWTWLRSDPLAKDFLSGQPDDWGMKLNPYYKSLGLDTIATDNFPKADLTLRQVAPAPPPGFGTLDMRPYVNDMHEAAYRALRADANVKIVWDETKLPPAYVSSGAQLPGQRFQLALVDSSSAARYGLNTAKLVNSAGQAIAPSATSIGKTLQASTPDATTGLRSIDPTVRVVGAYPLTVPVYAAVNLCASSKSELKNYATLITYAVGSGQVTGDELGRLPRGYVPISDADVKKAKSTAALLVKTAQTGGTCAPAPVTDTSGDGTTTVTEEPTDTPTAVPTPTATPTPASTVRTEDAPFSPNRLGLFGALVGGIPSMIAGPLLVGRGRRLEKLGRL